MNKDFRIRKIILLQIVFHNPFHVVCIAQRCYHCYYYWHISILLSPSSNLFYFHISVKSSLKKCLTLTLLFFKIGVLFNKLFNIHSFLDWIGKWPGNLICLKMAYLSSLRGTISCSFQNTLLILRFKVE